VHHIEHMLSGQDSTPTCFANTTSSRGTVCQCSTTSYPVHKTQVCIYYYRS